MLRHNAIMIQTITTLRKKAKADKYHLEDALQLVDVKVNSLTDEIKKVREKVTHAQAKATKVEEEIGRLTYRARPL